VGWDLTWVEFFGTHQCLQHCSAAFCACSSLLCCINRGFRSRETGLRPSQRENWGKRVLICRQATGNHCIFPEGCAILYLPTMGWGSLVAAFEQRPRGESEQNAEQEIGKHFLQFRCCHRDQTTWPRSCTGSLWHSHDANPRVLWPRPFP